MAFQGVQKEALHVAANWWHFLTLLNQRRLTGSGSALEVVLHDYALYKSTFTLLYFTCGETQTMSHIVESCPLTKLNGGLYRLHSADEDAVSWMTNYG